MRELGLDPATIKAAFVSLQQEPYALIEISPSSISAIANQLGIAVRRCYISDATLAVRSMATGRHHSEIIRSKLPDVGSTMAGDFGEILTSLVQIAFEQPQEIIDPWKLRLKASRTHPAPGSDVVQFALPNWPQASSADRLICSEVKTKSTARASSPIAEAIEHSKKDSARRLPKTLEWLREKALNTGIESVSLEQIERFINATEHPPANREFRAVAVICSSLLDNELQDITPPPITERALIVLSIPELKRNYESIYEFAAMSPLGSDED